MTDADRAAERLASYTRAGYTHVLVFRALHNEFGDLGDDTLPWCNEKSGHEWVRMINAKHAAGKLSYRVTMHYVRDLRVVA